VFAGYDVEMCSKRRSQCRERIDYLYRWTKCAGKSTVLRVISGLLKPRLGEVTLISTQSEDEAAPGPLIWYCQVPQNHSLFPEISVRENVRLGAFMLHDTALVNRRLKRGRRSFPNSKRKGKEKAGNLSGGQQRLVEFARCLMLDPTLIY